MLFIFALAGTLISVVLLLISPLNGVLATLVFKPVIDATWSVRGYMTSSLIEVISVAVPLFILPRVFFSRKKRLRDMQLSWLALILFAVNIIGVASIIAEGKFYSSADYFFRVLNTLLAFFLFQLYFTDREKFKRLIIALLIAGLFPVVVGIYQLITGHVWRVHLTSLGMVRYAGLYHDSVTVRIIGFQTLAAILLYWSYFVSNKVWPRFILAIYALACTIVIFRAYTKAGMVILVAWAVIWSVFTRKIHWLIIISLLILTVNFAIGNRIFKDTERVFMKEIGAYEGTMDDKYVLAGRPLLWNHAIKKWWDANIFKKMFGAGENPPVHNEYLRMLISNGIFGLLAFAVVIVIIAIRVIKNVLGRASPLNVVALMVFVMLFIDTIGLHPGMYPSYQWFIYGIITLSLAGIKGLEPNKKGGVVQEYAKTKKID